MSSNSKEYGVTTVDIGSQTVLAKLMVANAQRFTVSLFWIAFQELFQLFSWKEDSNTRGLE